MASIKRRLSLAACLAALIALASCQSGGSSSAVASTAPASSGNGSSAATSSAAPASSQLAPYKIVWYMGAGNPLPAGTPEVVAKANELMKPINATLESNIITWSDWGTKLPTLLASGQQLARGCCS